MPHEYVTGRVQAFRPDKGYGFILLDGGGTAYVHGTQIIANRGQPRVLRPGQQVGFRLRPAPDEEHLPEAQRVIILWRGWRNRLNSRFARRG